MRYLLHKFLSILAAIAVVPVVICTLLWGLFVMVLDVIRSE